VIDKMKGNIRMAAVSANPAAFTISFRYTERYKTQQTLQALIARMQDATLTPQRQALLQTPPTFVSEVTNLDVLVAPDLPVKPSWPNRFAIAGIGLCAGVTSALLLKLRAVIAA
jgi:hypothetical protein